MIIPSLPFHTAHAGSRLYFYPNRNNPFVVASDSELRRIMAPSIAPRSAYQQINPPNNREWRGRCKGGSIFGRKQISPFCIVNRHFSQILCW